MQTMNSTYFEESYAIIVPNNHVFESKADRQPILDPKKKE